MYNDILKKNLTPYFFQKTNLHGYKIFKQIIINSNRKIMVGKKESTNIQIVVNIFKINTKQNSKILLKYSTLISLIPCYSWNVEIQILFLVTLWVTINFNTFRPAFLNREYARGSIGVRRKKKLMAETSQIVCICKVH